MPKSANNGTGRGRLARIHTGTGERDDGNAIRLQRRVAIERRRTGTSWNTNTFAEERKFEDASQHFTFEWRPYVGIRRIAQSDNTANIKHLNAVTHCQLVRQVPGITSKCLSMAECADNDIAHGDGRHAARRQFKLVVAGLVVQYTHSNQYALFTGNVL